MRKKILSITLSVAIILTALPIAKVSAVAPTGSDYPTPTKLNKNSDIDYNPNFVYAGSNYQSTYDNIKAKSDNIQDIDELPDFDEFKTLTGYSTPTYLSLTKFREIYGTGSGYVEPNDSLDIYITNESELDLLSKLVSNKVDGETASEQNYYSHGNYKMYKSIYYTGTTYEPIGDTSHQFYGTFDGCGNELINIQLIDNVQSRAIYSGYDYLGVFGYLGSGGKIKRLGISAMTLTALYVLGGDAALLCARNDGTIEDCFVNGRDTSSLTISNSTAGCICGENYGTIRGCYGDAIIDVQQHSGTYSEPQPIATVNHTGANITNCYYIKPSLISADNTNNSSRVYYGWNYSGDYNDIYGTGLTVNEFVRNMSNQVGVSFNDGKINHVKTSGKTGYYMILSFNELRDLVDTGKRFINTSEINFKVGSFSGNTFNNGNIVEIHTRDQWNKLCSLVAKEEPNESDAEQEFWSHVSVAFRGNNSVIEGKSVEVFEMFDSDKTLGSTQYPFYGYCYTSRDVVIKLHINGAGGSVSPIIGESKGNINLNLIVDGDNISNYIGKNLICDTVSGGSFSVKIYDNSYDFTNDNQGLNVYSTDSSYNILSDKDYNNIALIGTLSGGNLNVISGLAYQWYSAGDTTIPIGYNYIDILRTRTGGNILSSSCPYVQDSSEIVSYSELNNRKVVRDNTRNVKISGITATANPATNTWDNKYISFSNRYVPSIIYPAFNIPEFDYDNKEYKVIIPQHLEWLIKFGKGENARLMNTIDMTYYTFENVVNTGYFNLNGLLTDTSDICNNIDLGVSKCYGVLNLQLNDVPLSCCKLNNTESNYINWRNVYFIGGKVIYSNKFYSTYKSYKSLWLGQTLNNVHISTDMQIDKAVSNSYFAPAYTANNCSVSSKIIANVVSSSPYYALAGNTADGCVSYTKYIFHANMRNILGLAPTATHCIFRGSTTKDSTVDGASVAYCRGLAENAVECKADGVYNFSTDTNAQITIFGGVSTNCTFSGEYYASTKDNIANVSIFGRKIHGGICTPESIIDGYCKLNYDSNDNNDIIFRGTYNIYIGYGDTCICAAGTNNVLIDGVINIKKNTDSSKYYNITSGDYYNICHLSKLSGNSCTVNLVCNGASNAVQNSVINFVGLDGYGFESTSIYMIGNHSISNSINYSNVNLDSNNCFIDRLGVDEGIGAGYIYNYGNFTLGDHSRACINIIGYGHSKAKNFGDVTAHAAYAKSNDSIVLMNRSTSDKNIGTYTNYGSITFEQNDDSVLGGVKTMVNCYKCYDYGDILVDYNNYNINKTLTIGTVGSIGLTDIEICNINGGDYTVVVSGGGSESYGNIYIHDCNSISGNNKYTDFKIFSSRITADDETPFNCIIKSRIKIEDMVCDDIEIQGMYRYVGRLNLRLNEYFVNVGSVEIDNINCNIFKNSGGFSCGSYYTQNWDWSSLYGSPMGGNNFASNVDIDVNQKFEFKNSTVSKIFKFYGCSHTHTPFDEGYRRNYSDIDITDSTINSLEYGGVTAFDYGSAHKPWINYSDLYINNVVLNNVGIISGISSSSDWDYEYAHAYMEEANSVSNAYNLGKMNINVSGAKVVVNGISDGSQINTSANSRNSIVLNAGDINVTSNGEIVINGIMSNGAGLNESRAHTSTSYVFNAINWGNLRATQTGNAKVTINGITDRCQKIYSVENFGTLSTNANTGSLASICGDIIGTSVGWVNYGEVSAPNFGSNQYITNIVARNSSTVLAYGINYGVFNNPRSKNVGICQFLIDLYGNKKALPDSGCTFSTDSTYDSTTAQQKMGYNSYEDVLGNTGNEGDSILINRYINYNDIINPMFAFRYDNFISTKYITSTTKEEYNSERIFEYSLINNTCGRLHEEINNRSGAGGYALLAVSYQGKRVIGQALDELFYNEDGSIPSWWSEFNVDSTHTLEDVINGVIKQRDKSSFAEVKTLSITSTDNYTTTENNEQNIQNTSMLIPFQAPVENESTVSENNVVSIIDLYVLVNHYQNIQNQDITWEVDMTGDSKGTLHIYSNPVTYNSVSDFDNGIKVYSTSPVITAENNITTLRLKETGGTNYAIIGYKLAEDNVHKNILAIRLHSSTTQPLGWLTSFSYATDVNSLGRAYVFSNAFKGNINFYNENKGTEAYTGDGYTLQRGTNESYTYPIYNMSVPMVRTTVGNSYTQDSFNSTGEVNFSFNVQNVESYRIKVSNEDELYYEGTGTPPTEGVSSADGTVIIKNNDIVLKTNTNNDSIYFSKYGNNEVYLTLRFNDNNPFYRAGDKEIEVFGTTISGDEIKLFEVNLHKESSFENYFKRGAKTLRYWFGAHDETLNESSNETIHIKKFYENYFDSNISELATSSNELRTISANVSRGSYTTYPEYIEWANDVTAENGDTVTYTHRYSLVDFNILDFRGVGKLNNCYNKDGTVVINDESEEFSYGAYINTNKVEELSAYSSLSNSIVPHDNSKFRVEKFDVYVGGVYSRTVDTLATNDPSDGIYDAQWGIKVNVPGNTIGFYNDNEHIDISKDNTVPKADLPDETISIKPYIYYDMPNGVRMKIECGLSTFVKRLNPDRQLIGVNTVMAMASTFVTNIPNTESEYVSIEGSTILYNTDYTELPYLYISDVVEPNCSSTVVGYEISPCAKLEQKVNGEWVSRFVATSDHNIYNANYTFEQENIAAGYTYEYRIVAQDYTTEDEEKATHITYFNHYINATTRNKEIHIEFKEEDEDTMDLYNEIINNMGNLSIQIKNMNYDQIKYQQTKFYVDNTSLESNYYNISQGDFAILVNIPEGYEARVKIKGASSEGYLTENPNVKGKRLRLPFANSQVIRLEVTLSRVSVDNRWGIVKYRSLCRENSRNYV